MTNNFFSAKLFCRTYVSFSQRIYGKYTIGYLFIKSVEMKKYKMS